MSCGTSTLKVTTFILDFVCSIFGALTIAACAYALAAYQETNAIRIPCILGIVLGTLVVCTTIFGCVAALRESIRLTWIYAVILLLLMFAQIAINFLQPLKYDRLASDIISNAWRRQLYGNDSMIYYEINYHCCGKTGPNNYPDNGLRIPSSCYAKQNSKLTQDLYQSGCIAKLALAFQTGTRWEHITDWTIVGVEGLAVILAGMFAITLQNAERRRLYR